MVIRKDVVNQISKGIAQDVSATVEQRPDGKYVAFRSQARDGYESDLFRLMLLSGWVKLGSTGTVTAWSLTQGDGLLKSQTPYAIVALASVAGLASLLLFTGIARTPVRIVTALVGLAIIGVTAANWAEIASYVTDTFPSSFQANSAIGFYLAIAGGVLVFVAALLPAKKPKAS